MSRSKSLWTPVLFVAALSLGACGNKVADIEKLAKEACACKDKACGEAVNTKLDAAIAKLDSEKDVEKAAVPLGQAGECLGKLGVQAK